MKWLGAMGLCALVVGSVAQAEVLFREGVEGYSSGKLATQLVRNDGLSGRWLNDTGVIVVNTARTLTYSDLMEAMSPAGSGLFSIKHDNAGNSTGRTVGALFANELPATGTLYISLLACAEGSALNLLMADQIYAMGLTQGNVSWSNDLVSKLQQDVGVWFGFGRIGTGTPVPMVKLLDERIALGESATVGETYLFVAKVEIGAADGLDRYSVAAIPLSTFDGTLSWQGSAEVALNPSTLKYLKVGGAYATSNSGSVSFDEPIIATRLYEVANVADILTLGKSLDPVTDATSATLTANVLAYQDGDAGTQLFIDFRRDNQTEWTTQLVGDVTATGHYPITLEGLAPGFHYLYRFRLEKAQALVDQTGEERFTTPGKPTVASWTLTPDGDKILSEAALTTSSAETSLSLVQKHSDGSTTTLTTFPNVVSGETYTYLWEGSEYGATYTLELHASYPTDAGAVTMDPVAQQITLDDKNTWASQTASAWSDPLSWSFEVVPDSSLNAIFATPATVTELAPSALAAKFIDVTSASDWDLAGSTLTAKGLHVGTTSVAGTLTLRNATLTLEGDNPSNLGSPIKGLYLDKASGSQITFGEGAMVDVGTLIMAKGPNNSNRRITIQEGAEVTTGGLWLENDIADFIIDGGKLTCRQNANVRIGVTRTWDGFRFTVKNGGIFDCSKTPLKYATGSLATFSVLDGAHAMLQSVVMGTISDQGGNNAFIVSNATVEVLNNFYVSEDGRHYNNTLYVKQYAPNERTQLTVGGNLNVAADNNGWGGLGRCYNHRLVVQGGAVDIAGALKVGGKTAVHTNNQILVMEPTSRITTKGLVMTKKSVLKYILPEKGFAQVPLQCTSSCSIDSDTKLILDVSNFKSPRQVLLTAPSLGESLFTEDRIELIPAEAASRIKVRQTAEALLIDQPMGTVIYIN